MALTWPSCYWQKGTRFMELSCGVNWKIRIRSLHNLKGVLDQITLHPASIEAYPSMFQIVQRVKPEECYHLAASSFVSYSFDDEFAIFNSNVNGTHYILSILKEIAPLCKFYFAGSSELFGRASSFPQNENTPFHPRSAYGITKATGYYLTCNYRDNYGLFGCNGIAYNHESTRRGYEFVTRKIVRGAVQIKARTSAGARPRKSWMQNGIGDMRQITSNAMWLMLQQDQPDDYVIATGILHSVRDLCEVAFSFAGIELRRICKS